MTQTLVEDEIVLGKMLTTVAADLLCKLITEKGVVGLPLSILWGNSIQKWKHRALTNYLGFIREVQQQYVLQRLNSVPCHSFDIQPTPPSMPPMLTSALKPILVVRMPKVASTFKGVIDVLTCSTAFIPVNLPNAYDMNLLHEALSTSTEKPEHPWNIHLVSYYTITARAKPANNGQLSHNSRRIVNFNEF